MFAVSQEADRGYCALCTTQDIYSAGQTWDELKINVKDAVRAHFFDQAAPEKIRLHLGHDEYMTL